MKRFCIDFKHEKSAWVKEPDAIDIEELIAYTTNLYTNCKSTG